MDLVFNWFADKGAWPEYPGNGVASLDAAVVGPGALLDHIETALGLGRPETPIIERIAIYQQKLKAAGTDLFWQNSFNLDPWSTTRELLAWRDELVEAGWRRGIGAERRRLSDLGVAETSGPQLPLGKADRIRAVIDELEEKVELPLKSITLIDDLKLLPLAWQKILQLLEKSGVKILEQADQKTPSSDEKITLINADTELAAAELLSEWLKADREKNKDIVFVLGNETSVLDHRLSHIGLPKIGLSEKSPHRSLIQILSLSFSLSWEPLNPASLLDFLLLPVSPLPKKWAQKLAKVVSQTPGTGSDEWNNTWLKIEEGLAEREDSEKKKISEKIARWKAFLEPKRYDPKSGIPKSAAAEICSRITAWALKHAALKNDPLFITLAQTSTNLAIAIEATDSDKIDRLLLDRMIEQAIGVGIEDPTVFPEAASWRFVAHPGGIWGDAQTIIWWNFTDTGEVSSKIVWNAQEREALSQAGCPLDPAEAELGRISAAWERPLKYAKKNLLLIHPALYRGEETTTHPLWHALIARAGSKSQATVLQAEVILSQESPELVGRRFVRDALSCMAPGPIRSEWTAPEGAISVREEESATSVATLLSCPLQWTLKYASKLYPGSRQSLKKTDQLIGLMAHKIAQEIFLPGEPPLPENVSSFARKRLEELLPIMGATLLLPGQAKELAAARRIVPESLADLSRFLRTERMGIIATEYSFKEKDTLGENTGVGGSIDLLANDVHGRKVVIDLKWAYSDKERRTELEHGVALQLAIYARHISDENVKASTGYYMLRQRKYLTTDNLSGNLAKTIEGPNAKETWEKLKASWSTAMDDLGSGKVRATYENNNIDQIKFSDEYLLKPPKCIYCDYVSVCKVSNG